jgi:hypothetical protein
MQLSTLPDVTGAGATAALSTGPEQARLITLTAVGGTARFGDSATSATRGAELPAGVPVTFRASSSDRIDTFQLNQLYAYVPNSTTLTITYGL